MSRVALSVTAIIVVWGCGSKSSPPDTTAQKPAPKATQPEREIEAGPTEIVQRDDNRKLIWSVRGESMRVQLDGDGKASGELRGVTGIVYNEAGKESTYRADFGHADQKAQILTLKGNVEFRSDQGTLKSESLVWRPAQKLVEAVGKVTFEGRDYSLGPFSKVFATPDLRTIGTPDQFKSTQ